METDHHLTLQIVPGRFSIHRLTPDEALPAAALASPLFSMTRTDEELSIVCAEEISLDSFRCEAGWSGIKVVGPLDFGLTGILADLSGLLAEAGISLFAISTFDTDYILVKSDQLASAVASLTAGGHSFRR